MDLKDATRYYEIFNLLTLAYFKIEINSLLLEDDIEIDETFVFRENKGHLPRRFTNNLVIVPVLDTLIELLEYIPNVLVLYNNKQHHKDPQKDITWALRRVILPRNQICKGICSGNKIEKKKKYS